MYAMIDTSQQVINQVYTDLPDEQGILFAELNTTYGLAATGEQVRYFTFVEAQKDQHLDFVNNVLNNNSAFTLRDFQSLNNMYNHPQTNNTRLIRINGNFWQPGNFTFTQFN